MIFRARQRRQAGEFQDVERQLALDDLDVPLDRFERIAGEAEDIAAIGDATNLAPGKQHLAVVADAVLLLLRADQALRIDVFEADEYAAHARRRRLFDEARDF